MQDATTVPHQLIMTDRCQLSVSGVSDVDSFDDASIKAQTPLGELRILGEKLHICRFSVESGDLSVEGKIDTVEYSTVQQSNRGLFGKIFK